MALCQGDIRLDAGRGEEEEPRLTLAKTKEWQREKTGVSVGAREMGKEQ